MAPLDNESQRLDPPFRNKSDLFDVLPPFLPAPENIENPSLPKSIKILQITPWIPKASIVMPF